MNELVTTSAAPATTQSTSGSNSNAMPANVSNSTTLSATVSNTPAGGEAQQYNHVANNNIGSAPSAPAAGVSTPSDNANHNITITDIMIMILMAIIGVFILGVSIKQFRQRSGMHSHKQRRGLREIDLLMI
jgi:hypothetical protein